MARGWGRVRALAAAAHPGPSLVVVAVVLGLGAAAGRGAGAPDGLGAGRLALLGAAVLAGQLSIGWANDWVDGRAGRDAGRADKPVATGVLPVAAVRAAALVALAVCAVLSLALGVVPGALHLGAVAGGWAYDLGLKATPASAVPYLLSFGLLPVIAATAAGGRPAAWAVVVAGLFGAGAHLANALPDLAQDARTGVRGLPQRLGARRSAVGAAVLLGAGAAGAVLAGAADGGWPAVRVAVAAAAAVLVGAVLVLGLRGRVAAASRCAMAAGLVVVGLLVAGDVAIT